MSVFLQGEAGAAYQITPSGPPAKTNLQNLWSKIGASYDSVSDFTSSTDSYPVGGEVLSIGGYPFSTVTGGGHLTNSAGTQVSALHFNGSIKILSLNPNANGTTNDAATINLVNVTGNTVDLGGKDYRYTGTFTPTATFINGRIIDNNTTHDYGLATSITNAQNTANTALANSTTNAAAIAAMGAPLGVGQTWQDVTASRSARVTYTNNTGRTILVAVMKNQGPVLDITLRQNAGATAMRIYAATDDDTPQAVVPPGYLYTITGGNILSWHELR